MPSRVIRDSIRSSDSLRRVSMQAELAFDRMILAADDYGRLDARPQMLKSQLFPMRDEVKPAQIQGWVRELAALEDPPILIYSVGGREYIELTGWEKHRGKQKRSDTSRFPPSPESTGTLPGDPRESGDSRNFPGDPNECKVTSVRCKVTSDDMAPSGAAAPARPSRSVRVAPPDRLTDPERQKLVEWNASRETPLTDAQLAFAEEHVLEWGRGKGEKKADWLATVRNAIREGWALRGFGVPQTTNGSGHWDYNDPNSPRYQALLAEARRRVGVIK